MKKFILYVLAIVILVPNSYAQVAPTMTKITEGIYHFFGFGYSSLVVVGDKGVLITDPASEYRAKPLKAEIAKITNLPVTHIVLSHEHYDHVGGTAIFGDTTVICHAVCQGIFDLAEITDTPQVDQSFTKSISLKMGKHQVEVMHIAPGDGVGTAIVQVKEAKVVFSADMYMPQAFIKPEFIEDTNLLGVRKTLQGIVNLKPTYAINGHSPGNTYAELVEYLEMYDTLYNAVMAEFKKAIEKGGGSAGFGVIFSLPNKLKIDKYSSWKSYDKSFPAYVRRMALSIFHGG